MNHQRGKLHQYGVAQMKKKLHGGKIYYVLYIVTMTCICDEGGGQ